MIGLDAKTYYGAAGATATTLLSCLKEVGLNQSRDDVVAGYRDSDHKSHDVGLADSTLSLTVKNKTADAGFRALMTAFDTRAPIALKVLDKETGEGIDADFVIISRDRQEPIDGKIEWTFELGVNTDLREPAWIAPDAD